MAGEKGKGRYDTGEGRGNERGEGRDTFSPNNKKDGIVTIGVGNAG